MLLCSCFAEISTTNLISLVCISWVSCRADMKHDSVFASLSFPFVLNDLIVKVNCPILASLMCSSWLAWKYQGKTKAFHWPYYQIVWCYTSVVLVWKYWNLAKTVKEGASFHPVKLSVGLFAFTNSLLCDWKHFRQFFHIGDWWDELTEKNQNTQNFNFQKKYWCVSTYFWNTWWVKHFSFYTYCLMAISPSA